MKLVLHLLLAALLLTACTDRRSEKVAEEEKPQRDVSGYLPGHGPEAPRWAPGGAPAETGRPPHPAAPRAAAEAETIARGEIRLAPGAEAPPSAVLFIIARQAGGAGGPPLAAKRIGAPAFPLSYTLTGSDSMAPGRSLEGRVEISARLDSDGNASTRGAGDLSGVFAGNPAEVGQTGVDIELAPPRP